MILGMQYEYAFAPARVLRFLEARDQRRGWMIRDGPVHCDGPCSFRPQIAGGVASRRGMHARLIMSSSSACADGVFTLCLAAWSTLATRRNRAERREFEQVRRELLET